MLGERISTALEKRRKNEKEKEYRQIKKRKILNFTTKNQMRN
jgi:hypothetical protein